MIKKTTVKSKSKGKASELLLALEALLSADDNGITGQQVNSGIFPIKSRFLNTIVSDLQNKHGIVITSVWQKPPNVKSHKRYWIAENDRENAIKLANHWRMMIGDKPRFEEEIA